MSKRKFKTLRDGEAYLAEGPGVMWNVRVTSSADDCTYVDFEVCAKTDDEAADKAELVASQFADFYFGPPEPPTYYAERENIERMEDA